MLFKFNLQILILFLCITTINQALIKIPEPNKNSPIPKLFLNFHPFIIAIEYIHTKINNKTIEQNIIKMKNLIERVPEIFENLLLINGKTSINYTEKLLEVMKIDIKNYKIKERIIKTNFLVIIQFVENNKNNETIEEKFTNKDGRDKFIYTKQKFAIGYLKINYNYIISSNESEEKFVFEIIQKIIIGIGFRLNYLKYNFIRNNFNNAPLYLIQESKIYQSHLKYSSLSGFNIINNTNEISYDFYKNYWNFSLYGFQDIMNDKKPDLVITEFTLNILQEISQITLPQCDLFEFEQGVEKGFHCLRVTQDCINKKEEKNYFLEYGIYNETKIKCYLNDKNNIKNKQCGIKFGNLEYNNFQKYFTPAFKQIKDSPLIGHREITELNFHKNQTLKLLKNPPSCRPNIPRSIFFEVPPTIFDEEKNNTNISILIEELKEINKDVQYDKVILGEKDRKYFVTYEAPEENYIRSGIIKVLNYSGLIRSFSNLHSHNLLLKVYNFKKLKEIGVVPSLQKNYCFPNFEIITNKYLEYKFYEIIKQSFPEDYNYMPETYSYPEQKDIIKEKFENYSLSSNNLWLIKPKLMSLGIGIHIFHNLSDVYDEYIITKYIHNPHLINKLKYDFRIYVLITGLKPLKIYLYKEGIIRFATEEYSLDINKIDDSFIFLTNVAHNKNNINNYKKPINADTEEGSKWSFQVYKNYCKKNGINFDSIWEQVIDISIKSVISFKDSFIQKINYIGLKDKNFFKLMGYDFLLDENLKVHLLEINSRPSLLIGDINDLKLKPQLAADILNIVGISPFSHDYRDNFKSYDVDDNYEENDMENLNNLEGVNLALCEFGRPRGRFQLIFPVKDTINKYQKFFRYNFEADKLLWEALED